MKYLLHTGLWSAGLAGIAAAACSDWRSYAEAVAVVVTCGVWLVVEYDYGKDDQF